MPNPSAGPTSPVPDLIGYTHREFPATVARTEVYGPDGKKVATFTIGARTAVFEGTERGFMETSRKGTVSVTHTGYVRVAPQPYTHDAWDKAWFKAWFAETLRTQAPDALGSAVQYIGDAAGFGLERDLEGVADGADFFDFLGVSWSFPGSATVAQPAARYLRKLDCSGFLRLVYAYHMGVIPVRGNDVHADTGAVLPRSAWAMASLSPHVDVAVGATPAAAPTDLGGVMPGDMVFFALRDDPAHISHSGIVVGKDAAGGIRFISSRSGSDGPTFADYGPSPSVINRGVFGEKLRRVIRL